MPLGITRPLHATDCVRSNSSSCFSNFIKSFIMIFEMSIEYIYCEKFRQTILRVVKLSDTRDYCKDIFNQ